MDFDPLADSAPSRYAIESDEEEDEYNPLYLNTSNPNDSPFALSIGFRGKLSRATDLIIVLGEAGKFWAKGAQLGEQFGSIHASNVEVGLVFNPTWTSAVVVVSEAFVRLPTWAQHKYAHSVLGIVRPARLVLLDTYPAPTYISIEPTSILDAPIRYLTTTAGVDSKIQTGAMPFAPPNIVQSTSASFVSLASTSNPTTKGTLILLPSNRIPPPPPRKILPVKSVSDDLNQWPSMMMIEAQQLLLTAVGEKRCPGWVLSDDKRGQGKVIRAQASDTGMYI